MNSGNRAEMFGDHEPPVDVDQYARHLVLLPKLVHGHRDHIVLPVPVQEDLFAETGVPEPSDDGSEIGRERLLGDDDIARHAEVVERMGAVPDGFSNRASGALGDLLGLPGHQEGVLTRVLGETVRFGAADRDDDQIVLFEPVLDLFPGHGLVIDARRALHVTAIGGYLPFAHEHCPFLVF
jgi:hypothetical protein